MIVKDIPLKKILLVITYCFFLFFVVIKFDVVKAAVGDVLGILMPFFFGIGVAFVLNKPMSLFERLLGKKIRKKGICRGIAITLSYILLIVFLVAITLFIVPQLVKNISIFMGNMGSYIQGLEQFAADITEKYNISNQNLEQWFGELNEIITDLANWILTYIGSLIPQLVTITSNIVSVAFNTVIALVVSINILARKEALLSQCKRLIYTYLPKRAAKIEHVARTGSDIFGKYVTGQLTEACILGCLCFIGMTIFRFDYAMLISALVAMTALIPVAGAWIGGGVAFILLALVSPMKAVLFIIFLVILQQLENSLIYPRVVGSSIGLPGLWVIFAVTVGGGLFGLGGIILGVPVMSLIYTLVREDVHRKNTIIRKAS